MTNLYRDYKEFMATFIKRGGIIEAYPKGTRKNLISSPSISILIQPNGDNNIIFAFDKIQGNNFVNIG